MRLDDFILLKIQLHTDSFIVYAFLYNLIERFKTQFTNFFLNFSQLQIKSEY